MGANAIRPFDFPGQHAVKALPIVGIGTVLTVSSTLFPMESLTFAVVAAATYICVGRFKAKLEALIVLLFSLVCWFPEFSETEWEVYTAEDFRSLYNFRPIAWITASAFDYLFALVVVSWVYHKREELGKLWKSSVARWMICFLVVCVTSLVYGLWRGNEAYYALREFRVSAYFVLFYLIIVTTITTRGALKNCVRAASLLAIATGLYGIFRYALGIGKSFAETVIVFYDLADSVVLYIGILVAISLGLGARNKAEPVFWPAASIVPMLFTLVFSFRRGAWLAFIFGLLFLLAFPPYHRERSFLPGRRTLLVAGAVSVLAIGIVWFGNRESGFVSERIQSIVDLGVDDSSNAFRILDSLNAFSTFAQNPVLGIGLGGRYALEYYSELAAPPAFWENVNRSCHNGYLFIMFKMGVIGITCYLGAIIQFFRLWFRSRRRLSGDPLLPYFCALGAIAMAIMINNIPNPVSDTLRSTMLLAFAMGLASAVTQITEGSTVLTDRMAPAKHGGEL